MNIDGADQTDESLIVNSSAAVIPIDDGRRAVDTDVVGSTVEDFFSIHQLKLKVKYIFLDLQSMNIRNKDILEQNACNK